MLFPAVQTINMVGASNVSTGVTLNLCGVRAERDDLKQSVSLPKL